MLPVATGLAVAAPFAAWYGQAEQRPALLVAALLAAAALAGWAAWRAPRAYWCLTVATAPLALSAPFVGAARLSLPLEALLLAGVVPLLVRTWCALRDVGLLARSACHPVSLALGAHLLWLVLASSTSVEPLVSLKQALARGLHVAFFYAGGLLVCAAPASLAARVRAWHTAVVAFTCGLVPVLGLTLSRHALTGFDRQAAYEAAQPFFDNRLELLALLVMLAPCGLAVRVTLARRAPAGRCADDGRVARKASRAWPARLLLGLLLALSALATLTLHARSAWLTWGLLLVAYPLLARRVQPRAWLAAGGLLLLATALLVGDLLRYRADALAPLPGPRLRVPMRDMLLHGAALRDASLAERANRWGCAWRMGLARPLQGFGPNTFERVYACFQRPWELTEHSTWQGDRGDAHSEFLTAWAEQGLPGLVLLVLLFGSALASGLRLWQLAQHAQTLPPGYLPTVSALTLALLGFALENLANGLLDLEKVAPFFWMLLAALVSLERAAPAPRAATNPGGY